MEDLDTLDYLVPRCTAGRNGNSKVPTSHGLYRIAQLVNMICFQSCLLTGQTLWFKVCENYATNLHLSVEKPRRTRCCCYLVRLAPEIQPCVVKVRFPFYLYGIENIDLYPWRLICFWPGVPERSRRRLCNNDNVEGNKTDYYGLPKANHCLGLFSKVSYVWVVEGV